MKKLFCVLVFPFLFINQAQSVRIITGWDIARWFLDADLVVLCSVNSVERISVRKVDSLSVDDFYVKYETIRELYFVTVDSVLKSSEKNVGDSLSFLTPKFTVDYSKEKTVKEFQGFNENGDSIYVNHFEVCIGTDYTDTSWFTLNSGRNLVILSRSDNGYIIDYACRPSKEIMNMLQTVKEKGELFFPSPLNSSN